MTQAEVLCLVGMCWKGFVYLWHGLTPFVLAAFPTVITALSTPAWNIEKWLPSRRCRAWPLRPEGYRMINCNPRP